MYLTYGYYNHESVKASNIRWMFELEVIPTLSCNAVREGLLEVSRRNDVRDEEAVYFIQGEGKMDKAKEYFSLFVYVSLISGVIIAILGILFIRPVASFLGAEGVMLDNCVSYGRVVLIALPAFMLQMEFQTFFVTAEKPQLGFKVTVAAGVANMVLDALFVAVFRWGLLRHACLSLQN